MLSRNIAYRRSYPVWLLAGFWLCVAISLAVVVRRLIELANPSGTVGSSLATINESFSSHALLTVSHIVPAALFVLLAVHLFLHPAAGMVSRRLFFFSGLITGLTAFAMSAYAFGGWVERSAVLVFDTWFLFSLCRAWLFHRRGDPFAERQWSTRAVGILLGIATTRPVMGVFFATRAATHLQPAQFFGIAFWIGFSINTALVELWLHSTWRAKHQPREVAAD
jgi:hypothetical protein